MNLPTLDYTSEEALQSSADSRAAVGIQLAEAGIYFKGLELKLTPSIESIFNMLSRLDGAVETGGDRDERDAVIMVYLASQPREKWSQPTRIVTSEGFVLLNPLRSRPSDWLEEIDAWFDRTFTCDDLPEAVKTVALLWEVNRAPRVVLEDDSQKKTAE